MSKKLINKLQFNVVQLQISNRGVSGVQNVTFVPKFLPSPIMRQFLALNVVFLGKKYPTGRKFSDFLNYTITTIQLCWYVKGCQQVLN